MAKTASELWAQIANELARLKFLSVESRALQSQIDVVLEQIDAISQQREDIELIENRTTFLKQITEEMNAALNVEDELASEMQAAKGRQSGPNSVELAAHILEKAQSARRAWETLRTNLLDILQELKELKADSEPKG